jgi:MFS family permease
MIDVTERSSWRFPLFFILYFIQGVVIIAVMTIIPLYFVEKAVSLPLTTLVVGIAMLPWSFKFFWGGFVDYFIQRGRRLFIILGALLPLLIHRPILSCLLFFYFSVSAEWSFLMLLLMLLQLRYPCRKNEEKLVVRCYRVKTRERPSALFFSLLLLSY